MKIKNVVFIFYLLELFNGIEYLYNYMKKHDNFNPILLLTPKLDNRSSRDNSDVKDYLKKNNYDFIEYIDNFDITSLKPNYIFYSTPYMTLFPEKIHCKYIYKICKICYFSYGYTIYDIKDVDIFGIDNIKKYFSYIFIENEFVYSNYKKYIDKRFFITGHPKVNYLLNRDITYTKNSVIKNILWSPRWIPENSNFDKYYNYFLKLADNKNINLYIRFHPLDCNNKRIFLFRIRKYKKNIIIDKEPLYIKLFDKIDIFISDLSTMITEFYPTGKPIIYTEHKNNKPNDFMKELKLYKVTNQKELDIKILDLINNNDEFKNTRKKVINKYYNKYNASKNICDILKD